MNRHTHSYVVVAILSMTLLSANNVLAFTFPTTYTRQNVHGMNTIKNHMHPEGTEAATSSISNLGSTIISEAITETSNVHVGKQVEASYAILPVDGFSWRTLGSASLRVLHLS